MSTACATDDHGIIMSSLKTIRKNYRLLGQALCIPEFKVDEIEENNRGKQWECLNGVVAEWLRGNTSVYDKGVRANARWLYDAVRTIDKDLGTDIAKGN